jgi:lysophospholipase L1-like esterase
MGDSITQNGGYLRAIEAVIQQQYPALAFPPILNAGISGQKAEDMVARFQRDIVAQRPAACTISVGVNDVWHRLDEPHDDRVLEAYEANVEKMARMAADAGARVYLLAPTVIEEDGNSEGNRRLEEYVAAGKRVAQRTGCTYVDLFGLFLRAIEERERGGINLPLTRDGVHMLPPGDLLMAVGILRAWGVPDEKMAATDVSGVFA